MPKAAQHSALKAVGGACKALSGHSGEAFRRHTTLTCEQCADAIISGHVTSAGGCGVTLASTRHHAALALHHLNLRG